MCNPSAGKRRRVDSCSHLMAGLAHLVSARSVRGSVIKTRWTAPEEGPLRRTTGLTHSHKHTRAPVHPQNHSLTHILTHTLIHTPAHYRYLIHTPNPFTSEHIHPHPYQHTQSPHICSHILLHTQPPQIYVHPHTPASPHIPHPHILICVLSHTYLHPPHTYLYPQHTCTHTHTCTPFTHTKQ